MNGPEKFKDWQDHHLPEKSAEFNYSDSTEEHIHKSQHFHYEGNDLPEKM